MNKLIFISIFTTFLIVQTGCSGAANVNQTNQTNVNSTMEPPLANKNPAVNAAAQETPLPQFTNADEALAEGVKLLDANATIKAIEALRQAVKLDPDSGEAHFRLGIAYAQIEKAAKDKEMTSTEPTPTPAPAKTQKNKKGKKDEFVPTADSEKSFAEAVKAYKKHLVKNPKDDVAHFNLGRSYNKLNNDEEAEKSLREAVKLKPEDTEYQTELGAILIKLAHYDEAVKALKKALEIDESNLQAAELLEKADAGKKRLDFGIPPKGANDKTAAKGAAKAKNTPKTKDDEMPDTEEPKPAPKPSTKNTNQ